MKDFSHNIIEMFLLVTVAFGCGYFFRKPITIKEEVEVVKIKKDTTIIVKENYKFCNIPTPVFYETHDTLMIQDTVYIKDVPEEYVYNEEDYDLTISATHLYGYELDIHKEVPFSWNDTQTTVRTTKNKVLNFGPQIGFGYGVFNKKPDLYVGFGLNINL